MKILALELSTARGGLAWVAVESQAMPTASREDACARNQASNHVEEWPNDRKNSGLFFEYLAGVRQRFGLPDTIIVGLGPGSYAGTRIAISVAIGLQAASNAKLIGFPSICALECDSNEYCVIGDARRRSFFFARIRANSLIEGPKLFDETGLKSKLSTVGGTLPILASESLRPFERAEIRYPSALKLTRLAQDTRLTPSLPPLEPVYLREPHVIMPKPSEMVS
jgi:tRNA threonylcarbamoyl adenosine modification protein YeaZ